MEKIFLFCAIVGSTFVVLQFIMSLIGLGGADVDGDCASCDDCDVGAEHSDASGSAFLRAFSIRTVTAGVAFFGLGGVAAVSYGLSSDRALGIAIVCGVIALYSVYFMIRSLSAFNANGSIRANSALGAEGEVYLTIPAKRQGYGKVMIIQQERTMEYEATSDSDVDIKVGAPIVVVGVLSSTLLLVKERSV